MERHRSLTLARATAVLLLIGTLVSDLATVRLSARDREVLTLVTWGA